MLLTEKENRTFTEYLSVNIETSKKLLGLYKKIGNAPEELVKLEKIKIMAFTLVLKHIGGGEKQIINNTGQH